MTAGSEHDVTVVIPAYNAEETIAETIASARAATAGPVIVVDDGSTDSTAQLATQLGCTVVSQVNQGAAAARLSGIQATRTSFVVLLDSDDQLSGPGLSESLRLARDATRTGQPFSAVLGATDIDHVRMPRWLEPVSVVSLLDKGRPPGPPAAFLWRTDSLREAYVNLAPEALMPRYADDYELAIRGARTGPILQHDEIVCSYRAGGGKSAKNAMASINSAESLRRYYAVEWSIPIHARSNAQIRFLAALRTGMGQGSSTNWLPYATALRHPLGAAHMAGQRWVTRKAMAPQGRSPIA